MKDRKWVFLSVILLMVLAACSPSVSETTATSIPSTSTPLVTEAPNPTATATEEIVPPWADQITLEERALLDAADPVTMPASVREGSALAQLGLPVGAWLDIENEAYVYSVVNGAGEKVVVAQQDANGNWEKANSMLGTLCATGVEADAGACVISTVAEVEKWAAEAAKLNAGPIPAEVLAGLDKFQPGIVGERNIMTYSRLYGFDEASRAYYQKHLEEMPVSVVGYFNVPFGDGSNCPGRVLRWVFKEDGQVVTRYVPYIYAAYNQAALDQAGLGITSQISGDYSYDVPAGQENLFDSISTADRDALLHSWEENDMMPLGMEKKAFVGLPQKY